MDVKCYLLEEAKGMHGKGCYWYLYYGKVNHTHIMDSVISVD